MSLQGNGVDFDCQYYHRHCHMERNFGWSEPAATNAPVEDEPVQPVLRMNILPARGVFFF